MTSENKNVLKWPKGELDFSKGSLIMGILNVTEDSFSDGGQFFDTKIAIAHGIEMASQGAAIIDIGGESTRPGSQPVSAEKQIERVVPVIKALSAKTNVPISIDTNNIEVAKEAIDAGASIINDITALEDQRIAQLASEQELPVILMHMQGKPSTMQKEPKYEDVVDEVLGFLLGRAKLAEKYGIPSERIFIDPGIGFGKTLEHNLLLMKNLDRFVTSGYKILVGASRKSFLGTITGKQNPSDRIFGTAATVALCATAGVSIVRVHDVEQMLDVIKVTQAIIKKV